MSLDELKEGQRIRVLKSFVDFDGQTIPVSSTWTFTGYSYFPYDEGYTFQFREGEIRLAGIDKENEEVLNQFSVYFELA